MGYKIIMWLETGVLNIAQVVEDNNTDFILIKNPVTAMSQLYGVKEDGMLTNANDPTRVKQNVVVDMFPYIFKEFGDISFTMKYDEKIHTIVTNPNLPIVQQYLKFINA